MCKKCRYFPTLFFASSIVSSLASARKNPHPCLASALGPQHQHTHMSFGASFCPSLLRTTGNERSTERKNPVLPRQEVFIYLFKLLLRVAYRPQEVFRFSFSVLPVLFHVNFPPAVVAGLPASPPFPVHSAALLPHAPWGPDCSRPEWGGLGAISLQLPVSSSRLASGQSNGGPRSPSGARGQ